MDFTTAIGVIVGGVITPFIVAIMTHPTMQPTQKRAIALGVAVTVGFIVAVATGAITEIPVTIQEAIARSVVVAGIVVALAQGYYHQFKGAVKNVEAKTADGYTDA